MERADAGDTIKKQYDTVRKERDNVYAEYLKESKEGGNPFNADRLFQQWIDMGEDVQKLHTALKNTVKMTKKQLEAAEENLRLEYLKKQYGSLIEKTITVQDSYLKTLEQMAEDKKGGRLKGDEYDTILANMGKQLRDKLGIAESPMVKLKEQCDLLAFALKEGVITQAEHTAAMKEAMEKWDPVTQAAAELAKETERFADKFRGIGKTPAEAFKELSVDLRKASAALKPAEIAAAKDKLLADLANGLGIEKYLADAPTLAQQLTETYKKLDIYAREAGLSQQELTDAQNRAKAALEKQSEYYSLYQKAQDAMLTTQQKLQRELKRIADEAAQWGWDKDIVKKMEELKTAELFNNIDKITSDKIETKAINASAPGMNAAIEAGTMAYYEKTVDATKPILNENKKQTRYLANIDRKTQRQETGKQISFAIIS